MEAMMKRAIALAVFLFTAASTYACRPPYLEYYAVFEPGSDRLSGAEVKRLVELRINTRRSFPAGYTVYLILRQNDSLGIPHQLAEARSRSLTGLLEDLSVGSLLALSVSAHAEQVPEAIIDSCLLFDRSSDSSISISPIEGDANLIDEVTVPGYQLFTPGSDGNKLRIGYAASKRGSNDYIFVGPRRGFIVRAVAVGRFQPSRLEEPSLAAYAVLRQRGQRYVCVMESKGNGSAAFVRSAFVGRIPLSKNATLKLFYKVADLKKHRTFSANEQGHAPGFGMPMGRATRRRLRSCMRCSSTRLGRKSCIAIDGRR